MLFGPLFSSIVVQLKKVTPGDGPHVELDGAGPVLDVAKFLQFVVETVDELKPVLSLICRDN